MIESNSVMRHRDNSTSKHDQLFDNLIWLTTNEVAIYLRRLTKDGKPSVGAIRNLIYRGKLRARKFWGAGHLGIAVGIVEEHFFMEKQAIKN